MKGSHAVVELLAGKSSPAGHDGLQGPPGVPEPPKPKRGRPRCAEEPCSSISIWLPTTAQDRIIQLATQRQQSVSEYLRDVMLQLFMHRS